MLSNPEESTLQTSVSPIAGIKGYKHFLRKESHLPMDLFTTKETDVDLLNEKCIKNDMKKSEASC